jgi:CheY-like chemotaxis protein
MEAVALYTEKGSQIDLVITDLNMPGMDGTENILAIRKLNPQARIIVITGAGLAGETLASKQLNAAGILNKPFDAPLLLKTVHGVLQSRQK